MGTHISKVRSIMLDEWEPEFVEVKNFTPYFFLYKFCIFFTPQKFYLHKVFLMERKIVSLKNYIFTP